VEGSIAGAPDQLNRGANSLIITTAGTSLLGVVFWIVAARKFDAGTVGTDGALLAALVEISTVCQLNLDNALPRYLPMLRGNTARLLAAALGVSAAAALVVGVAFVLVAPLVSNEFAFLNEGWTGPAFIASLVAWGWFTLQDSALVGLRRAPVVAGENITFSLLKLAALPIIAALGWANGVFYSWMIPVLPLLLPITFFLFRRALKAHEGEPPVEGSVLRNMHLSQLASFHLQDYFASILARAATTFLPLLVVATLGSEENAYFFIPFTMIIAFDLLFYGVATSVVVEGSFSESDAPRLARSAVKRYGVPFLAASLALIAGAHLALLPFGTDYADAGDNALRILACGSVFRAVIMLFVALERVGGRGRRILAVEAAVMVILIPLALVLSSPFGINGVAAAWTIANVFVAVPLIPFLITSLSAKTDENADQDMDRGQA
jgi:O-antigen/teichoic acid export membrane protein